MMNPPKSTPRPPRREKTNLSSSSESEKMKDPVSVFCRLRNLNEGDVACIKLASPTVLCISCPTESKVMRNDMHYVYKHIFTSYATQKEVFDHVALPLLGDLLMGKNGLLFTYGVTGSGKTYTLTGEPGNPGIMPRCIDTIFNTVGDFQANKFVIKSDKMNGFEVQTEEDAGEDRVLEHKSSSKLLRKKGNGDKISYSNDGGKILGINETNLYAIFISYIEIYNNTVYDLLDESSGKTLQSKILREDSGKNMYVNGVVEVEVKSAGEAFELFNAGQKRKRMGHTVLNSESSRSHSIFNIRVAQLAQIVHNSQGERVIPDRNLLKVGQLSLVDLAGSERSNRTQNKGMRLKEASSINNSLMTLRNCLEILRDNQVNGANRLVPYRDSRLTLLFKNYFEGEGKVEMVVCVNPSIQDYEENLQVMKFAELTQDVKVIRPESRYTPYRKTHRAKTIIDTPIAKIKTRAPLVFGPKLHYIKQNFEDLEVYEGSIKQIIKTLQTRKQKSIIFKREGGIKEQHFRKRLTETNDEFTLKIAELRSKQQQYLKEKKKTQNLEIKILELEKCNDVLNGKNEDLSDVVKSLRSHLDEKDLKLNQNLIHREKQKQKMQQKQEKMNQELDEKLRKQRQHLNAQMQAKEHKLQKMREILDKENTGMDYEVQPLTRETIPSQVPTETHFSQTPQSHTKFTASSHHLRRNPTVRRRSRSVGEVWLEHNAVKPVPLGTVLQPMIKKRKSVTKLSKASDVTNPKQSKYCLIAQEPDTDGEVETKVYKGDIVPTCGGGAQVIFNDVERLRQESPCGTPQK